MGIAYQSDTLNYLPPDFPADEVNAIRELAALAVKHVEADPEATVDAEAVHEVAQTLLEGHCDSRTLMIFFMSLVGADSLEAIQHNYPSDLVTAAHNVSIIRLLNAADNPKHPPIRKVLLRQLVLKVTHDVRVILVKIAGRLVVLRKAAHWPDELRQRLAQETLEVVIPWCDALGLENWRQELQELCFKYLSPQEYAQVLELMKDHRDILQQIKEQVTHEVSELLEKHTLKAAISGRVKTHYAVYRKMQAYQLEYDEVWDRLGIRILAHSVFDCYYIMMAIEEELYPDRRRFVDYIEKPRKPYNYQSLHLTVCGPKETMVEFQIRTYDMHIRGEFGVAAHWKMYGGGEGAGKGEDEKFAFLRTQASKLLGDDPLVYLGNTLDTLLFNNSILPTDTEGYILDPDTGERFRTSRGEDLYYRHAKTDHQGYVLDPHTEKPILSHNGEKIWFQSEILPDRVIVYTPNGDLKSLPKGATPLDFAYYVHEDVGNTCVGAKINGKLQKLDYELQIGDRVEIITRKGTGPSLDWLYNGMAKTRRAHDKIKRFFREKSDADLPDVIDLGRAIVQKRLGAQRIRDLDMGKLAEMLKFKNERELLEALGTGEVSVTELDAILGQYVIEQLQADKHDTIPQTISSKDFEVLYTQAQCCLPVPGDEVISYISQQGKGFSLHRKDCHNIHSLEASRIRPFSWPTDENKALIYFARLTLLVVEPSKTILHIKEQVSVENLHLEFIKMRGANQIGTRLELVFRVANREQVERLMRRLNLSHDILLVRRTSG